MDILTIFLIAIGLSFDTFAVSVSSGLLKKEIEFFNATKIAFTLAFFQGLMPVIGWIAGLAVKDLISSFDHWVAFALLAILGIKMIWESFKSDTDKKNADPMKLKIMITMAIATSIDALVVGISFSIIDVPIILSILIIGSVTFIVSMLGILFGKKTAGALGKKMEIFGGLILIGIGVKILIQHIFYP